MFLLLDTKMFHAEEEEVEEERARNNERREKRFCLGDMNVGFCFILQDEESGQFYHAFLNFGI